MLTILFFTMLYFLVLASLGTVLNILVTYFIVRLIKPRRLLKWPLFILVSAILGFNVRLPGMLSDWVNGAEEIKIITPLEIPGRLNVISNTNSITLRSQRYDVLRIGANEGCMCQYWVYPLSMNEDVYTVLENWNIPYRKVQNADASNIPTLKINQKSENGAVDLTMELSNNGQILATYSGRLRNYFPFEGYFSGMPRSFNQNHIGGGDAEKWYLYLAQNNVWNELFDSRSAKQTAPLDRFLQLAISNSSRQVSDFKLVEASANLVSTAKSELLYSNDEFYNEAIKNNVDGCGDKLTLKPRYSSLRADGYNLIFTHAEGVTSKRVRDFTPKVMCSADKAYVFTKLMFNRSEKKLKMLVYEYSLVGEEKTAYEVKVVGAEPEGENLPKIVKISPVENGYELEVVDTGQFPENLTKTREYNRYTIRVTRPEN